MLQVLDTKASLWFNGFRDGETPQPNPKGKTTMATKTSKANKRAAERVAAEVKKAKTPKAATPCMCYSHIEYWVTAADVPEADPNEFVDYPIYGQCGETSKGTFAPGHDAKMKSVLITEHLRGQGFNSLRGGSLHTTDPMNLAAERGWQRFLDAAMGRHQAKQNAAAARRERAEQQKAHREAERQAKANQKAQRDAAKANEPTESEPTESAESLAKPGFAPVRVKIGRWVYDATVVEDEGGDTLTVQYQVRGGRGKVERKQVKRSAIEAA